jgi:GMP synthase (glutamine-hydrolysing)
MKNNKYRHMKLLVVEGNNRETRLERGAFGIKPYYQIFSEMLNEIVPYAEIDVAFPADDEKILPSITELKAYDGVLWTGSSLSVLDLIPTVTQQLNFAENVFKSGVPFYGSCWGLQVATVVAGGSVAKSNNGLELDLSNPIQLTREGKKSPLFKGRENNYQALCIHYDEVSEVPENTTVLAYNSHSKVQAMTFEYLNSTFFGVQYHPEFSPIVMAQIISFLKEKLIESNYFSSEAEVEKEITKLKNPAILPKEITNYKLHTQEISSWIQYISKN